MKTASVATASRAHKRYHSKSGEHSVETADPLPNPGAVSEPDQPFEEGAHDSLDPDLRHRLISEAAFDLYTRRGFVDGNDVDDWLSAEAQVDHMLLNPQFTEGGPNNRTT